MRRRTALRSAPVRAARRSEAAGRPRARRARARRTGLPPTQPRSYGCEASTGRRRTRDGSWAQPRTARERRAIVRTPGVARDRPTRAWTLRTRSARATLSGRQAASKRQQTGHFLGASAEGEGFEPSDDRKADNGFRDLRRWSQKTITRSSRFHAEAEL